MIIKKEIILKSKPRGFHLVTSEIISQIPEINPIENGILFLHLMHTSASLALNENADPTVRVDFESYMNRAIPEGQSYYHHTLEGSDDMPAHIKSSLLGVQLWIPITNGKIQLGTWQGIYLGEHRNNGGPRKIIVMIYS